MLQRFRAKPQARIDESNSELDAGYNGTIGSPTASGVRALRFSLPAASAVYSYSVSASAFSAAAPYQVTALAAANVSTAVPSWISQIKTASIATNMSAAIVNGQVTYTGLLTLLNNLDSQLVSSKTTLTSGQFTDLKTIVANLNNGVTTPAYLTSIMNSLVLGSAANATWTGGAVSSTSLGNLNVGANATKLSELIGKWFLGTDLPSSRAMIGGTTISVSYSNSSSPLFSASGPNWKDVNQGFLGDCYLESCLAEVAYKNPSVISSMITVNNNGTYGIHFSVNGSAQYVTVNASLANGGGIFNYGPDIWASLIEKGYAQLQASGVCTGSVVNYGNSWSTIGNGGMPDWALAEITGASTITDFYASGGTWASYTYNASHSIINSSTKITNGAIQNILIADLAAGDDVILGSWSNGWDSSGKRTLVAGHAFSIYGFDSATGMFQLRNPWGTESGQYWDTTFEVSLSTLLAAGDSITVDNIGGKSKTAAPILTAQTATQTWNLGSAVNSPLAANAFTDPLGLSMTYRATLADGSALPSWLKFNTTTGTFTGTVPNTATGLNIKVTATDTSGLSASETFAVTTPSTAPVRASQTAAQTWKPGQPVKLTLAANTFSDPRGEKLTYSAAQANGSALPSWLSFNTATQTFGGTAPNKATGLGIKVTATDTSCLCASETFSASVAAATSMLSHAIARSNSAPPAALANLIRPVQGVEANHLFGPKASAI